MQLITGCSMWQSQTYQSRGRRLVVLLIAGSVAASALAGATAHQADASQASVDKRAITVTYLRAIRAIKLGDGRTYCEQLTPAAAEKFANADTNVSGTGCGKIMRNTLISAATLIRHDWWRFCSVQKPEVASRLASSMGSRSCGSAVYAFYATQEGRVSLDKTIRSLKTAYAQVPGSRVIRIRLKGKNALVRVKNGAGRLSSLSFKKLEGHWRIAN